MKIHIVCRNAAGGLRILPRLARTLAEATGWSVGEAPDPGAELNYFFPYLDLFEVGGRYEKTKTAAWFTHHDTHQRGKGDLWKQAAAAVDLRLTSARIYVNGLGRFGPTGLVTPPLDREKFRPDPGYRAADVPVVGVSGWVYPGGRKGEGLLKQLVASELGRRLHFVACGQGWVVPAREVDQESLETFYQQLDIYLCTSLVEGVPYGPLEALACGKKVVIPIGVGLLDDLPDMEGVHRFKAGDFGGMCRAIEAAVAAEGRSEALRAATEPYSPKNWANDHQRAFERLLDPPRIVEVLPPWDKNKCSGVYYVAFGGPSREMAKKAISSFKRWMPGVEVALVSNRPLGAGEDVFIKQPDKDIGGRIAKINIDRLAPAGWKYVLYLDADTEVVGDIGFLFQALADGWEFVICKNPGNYHVMSEMKRPDNLDEAEMTFEAVGSDQVLQLNGGVFAYRRGERAKRFFDLWLEEWNVFGKRDQAALHRALWRQPLQTYVLGNEWNTITRYDNPEITAGILHYPITARRWSGRIEGRLDSKEAWAAVRKGK